MHITTADPNCAPGALLAPIHQRHKGLTTITVRRRGADTDLVHAVLHDAGNQPVTHGVSPSDTPEQIATELWARITADAHTRGGGTYDVTLNHAAAEKGTPPKPVVLALPAGHQIAGVDASTQTSLYVAQFCAGALDRVLQQLPALVEATGSAIGSLHTASARLAEAREQQANVPAELEIARLEAQRESDRWARLESMLSGPLGDLRKRLKQAPGKPPSGQRATTAIREPDAAQPRSHETADVVEVVETPAQQIIRLGNEIGRAIQDDAALSEALRALLDDDEMFAGVDKLAQATTHGAVLDVLARLTVHPRRIELMVLFDGPLGDKAERIAELASSAD